MGVHSLSEKEPLKKDNFLKENRHFTGKTNTVNGDLYMNKTRGFTLIELLVVIVILGVLIGYVAPNYFNQLQQSKVSVARTQIYAFENALDNRIDIGKYPETRQGLSALVTQPAGIVNWNGRICVKQYRKTLGE